MSIPSSPATFSGGPTPAMNQSLTFAIPAGAYISGTWTITYTNSTPAQPTILTGGGAHSDTFPSHGTSGAHTDTLAVTSAQIADINTAAGGNLSASLTGAFGTSYSISSLTLDLVAGASGGTSQAVGYSPGGAPPAGVGQAVAYGSSTQLGGTGQAVGFSGGAPPTGTGQAVGYGAGAPPAGVGQAVASGTGTALTFPPVPGHGDVDVRFFDRNGVSKELAANSEVTEITFDILERGGCGNGTLTLLSPWEHNQFTGSDYCDIYLFGQSRPTYRGWFKAPRKVISESGETFAPELFGLADFLNGYDDVCQFAYPNPVDLSVLFTDIITHCVKTDNRMPNVVTDAQVIGVTVQVFDGRGKSVFEALNALADLAPDLCIWGGEVSDALADVLYLRPRSATATHWYGIGQEITELDYTPDYGAIVNSLILTGGPVSQPNELTNGSFEAPLPNSETLGNLLSDYSFELGTAPTWTLSGGASRKQGSVGDSTAVGFAHTGSWWLELDTNGEKAEQTVNVNPALGHQYQAVMWVRREDPTKPAVAGAYGVLLEVDLLNASNALLHTFSHPSGYIDPGSSGVYARYTFPTVLDFSPYPTATKAKVRVITNGGTAHNDGMLVDDVALYEVGVGQTGWRFVTAGNAAEANINWAFSELDADPTNPISPYHGCYAVRAQASGIAVSTDYLEIRTAQNARMQLKDGQTYTLIVRIRVANAVDPVDYQIGVTQYKSDGTVAATAIGLETVYNGYEAWAVNTLTFIADTNAQDAEVFVRLHNNNVHLIDGVMLVEGNAPNETSNPLADPSYWEADTYQREMDVTSPLLAGPLALSADAAASITVNGIRQGRETQSGVVDLDTALAFAQGYFNANAVPRVQGPVTLYGIREPVALDGTLRIWNLPNAPADQFPAKVTYTVGADIKAQVDLGNEKPDLAALLQLEQKRAKASVQKSNL